MIITSFVRVIKFSGQKAWRNIWLSLITLTMMVLTLVTVTVLIFANVITSAGIKYVEERIEVSVYLQPAIPDERLSSTVGYLQTLPQVRDVSVITSDEAYTRFTTRHAGDDAILASLEEVDENPFGPTLVIRAYKTEDFPFIIEALDNPQFRDYVRDKDLTDYTQIIDRMRNVTDRVRMVGIALSSVFLLISLLVVFNTVRMGIFIHREEISIMKLVGASNWFVRAPFFLEAIGASVLATAIVAAVSFPILQILDVRLLQFFDGQAVQLVDFYLANAAWIFGGEVIALSIVTLVSSWFAMRHYLHV